MKIKPFGFIAWIADTVVLVLIIVGLSITWLKPGDNMPGENFKVNHYGKAGLRHTCKAGNDAFNEGCLVYQGSVIMIVLSATGLFTIAFAALYSLMNFCVGDKLNEESDDAQAKVSEYIVTVSVTHLALFFQLLVGIIAYGVGSHRIRKDFKYEFSAGWILMLVSTIITFCIAVMFFIAQCTISKMVGLIALLAQAFKSFIPFGSLFIVSGLCTSFYTSPFARINALKFKMSAYIPGSGVPVPTTKIDLSEFCSEESKDAHLCSLYRSSATIIAFTVFGILCCGMANDLMPKKKRIIFSIASFVFFFVGFVQYAAVGSKVKKDNDMHYGLGWIFYLCGVCLNGIGVLLNTLITIFFGSQLGAIATMHAKTQTPEEQAKTKAQLDELQNQANQLQEQVNQLQGEVEAEAGEA